jgi:uncharacterized protein YhfF
MTDWCELETFSFGNSSALADELAALVLTGIKNTCWAAIESTHTHVGTVLDHPAGALESEDWVLRSSSRSSR